MSLENVKDLINLLKDLDQSAYVTGERNEKNGNIRVIIYDNVSLEIIKKHKLNILD
jgi:hypothetical protein